MITNGLVTSIRKRDSMSLKIRKQRFNRELINLYKRYNGRLKSLLRVAKESYFRAKFIECSNDLQKVWRTLNEVTDSVVSDRHDISPYYSVSLLLYRDLPNNIFSIIRQISVFLSSSQRMEIADEFNRNFTSIGTNISNSIEINEKIKFKYIINRFFSKSFFFNPVTSDEIGGYIKKLTRKVSPGTDGIYSGFLIDNSVAVSTPLVHVINLCFQQGYFPDEMKHVVVVPIHKAKE